MKQWFASFVGCQVMTKLSPLSTNFSTYCPSVNLYHYILTPIPDSRIVFGLAETLVFRSQDGERTYTLKRPEKTAGKDRRAIGLHIPMDNLSTSATAPARLKGLSTRGGGGNM
jgi:hypothetical protein